MLNWAQCVGTSVAVGEFNGDEWISFVGPAIACVVHSALFIAVPPSHTDTGRFRLPILQDSAPSSLKENSIALEDFGGKDISKAV